MPGRRAKARAFGPWADPDFVPPPPSRSKKQKKNRRTRHKKRFHHAFRVLLALGLVPTKSRQCDPLGLRLNRMHVMDTECEKIGGGCLTAESAPELAKPSESPLSVGDSKTPQAVKDVAQQGEEEEEEAIATAAENLVNGGSDHPSTADNTCSDTRAVAGAEEELEEEEEELEGEVQQSAQNNVVEEMEVDVEKRTKEITEEEEEEELLQDGEDEVIAEEEGGQLINGEGKDEGTVEELEDGEETMNRELDMEEEVTVSRNDVVEEGGESSVEEIKRCPTPRQPAVEANVTEQPPIVIEANINDSKVNEVSANSKPASSVVPVPIALNKELKEEPVVIPVAENQARPSIALINKPPLKEAEKRKIISDKEGESEVSSGSESDTCRKKIKVEPDLECISHEPLPPRPEHPPQHIGDDDRERFIQEFISQCSQNVEEIDRAAERLHKEVETLAELARAKEIEWNAILRVRKMREEMLERLLRKRRLATEEYLERTHLENSIHKNINKFQGNNQLMMVPIVSSSPGGMMSSRGGPPPVRLPEYGKQQRPILPKPYANIVDPNCATREGRNGPIVDVKSIIADYRCRSTAIEKQALLKKIMSRHPESVPRRGRRMRGGPMIEPPPNRMSANPSLISMANMALGSGASIRTVNDSPYNLSQDHSRPSSTDPGRGLADGGGNMGYKEVLVQFAKMTSQAGVGHGGKGPPNGVPPPPPPYPEVTLHPVSRPGSSPPTPPSSSLLHGILTKSSGAMGPATAAAPSAASARPPANFSPTLARLLTAPDRPPHPVQPPPHFRPQHPPRVSIADILSSSKKSRNEITITPVSGNPSAKPKEDVVLLQDDDEAEVSDRLVIDESADNEEIPQCQGCRQKPAQFVCAGCGNQWYCSRECQVTAWEEHSDVCSG